MAFEKFSGKTLEEALNLACQSKGVSQDELYYTVLEEKVVFLALVNK